LEAQINAQVLVMFHVLMLYAVTSEPSVVNRRSTAREVRHTDAALPPTEPDTPSSILSTANLCVTTPTTLSNTSLWT
jgi:hypothetical protein